MGATQVLTPDDPDTAGRPTLEVVAARAGVSRATASRVLRGAPNVSDEARTAVLEAARELSYTVNRAARSLVTRRSDTIAFVVAEDEHRMFGDPYFVGILRGAHAETAGAGLQLLFVIASSTDDRAQFELYAKAGHVDGALLVSLHGADDLPKRLEAIGVPTVLNGRSFTGDCSLFSVDADNVGGGYAATTLLIERGAQRIATITGPLDMAAGEDRLVGYRQALSDASRAVDERLIATGDFSVKGGVRAMAALLDAVPDLDGVFASSDLTAHGALQTLAGRGKRVPDDVAVVGFDDVRLAELAVPPLTTIRQPIEALGRTMARVLLDRIANRDPEHDTVLPVEVVHRDTA
jgi:DNA-binding LacI/PurR family transcriptional regulator